ncbi:hemolysin secretion protein D [Halarcobacter ebronensis]|uniref:Hemolysin secretion protein D n=1 Tax=Halarcobacter ebronensis TaxID=1462615 RepID=A0A4Q0Y940_9BACT|nr:efflux RND transporter periplasmic adaptor subunit [Halarcobacter ebronensis]QKF81547.1 multidrug resistance ABC transporter, membrane fusion protein [Halarcobacter ebronensis]RXJ66493.1 hemolysin secretion protein D [Halarcobacter ebronensis]RXK05475.1 hemolysin secretion protein D [Halarcobacter ebronensis]
MRKTTFIFIPIITALLLSGCFKKDEETKFYGNIDLRTVSLGFRVGGKIDTLYFDEGQTLKKGDLIAQLKDDLYLQALKVVQTQLKMQEIQTKKLENGYRTEDIAQGKATYDNALVALNKAKKDFDRYEELKKTKSVSKQTYEDYKFAYDSAKAQFDLAKSNLEKLENGYQKEDIEAAKAQLETLKVQEQEAKINLEDTKLYAPNDGTILTRAYEVGAIVDKGTPIVEMALTNEYWVRSYIDEKYLGLIRPTMQAKVFTDSKPDKEYKAVVSFISAQAEFTPKSVQTQELRTQLVYRIRLIIKNPDEYIRQGMPVTIEFEDLD